MESWPTARRFRSQPGTEIHRNDTQVQPGITRKDGQHAWDQCCNALSQTRSETSPGIQGIKQGMLSARAWVRFRVPPAQECCAAREPGNLLKGGYDSTSATECSSA